jgi:hypothetical protein
MYVRKDCMTFRVLDQKVDLISDETAYGQNTVAEINGRYYYLADEHPGIATAINAWQEVNGRELTIEELNQVMMDNHLSSGGI